MFKLFEFQPNIISLSERLSEAYNGLSETYNAFISVRFKVAFYQALNRTVFVHVALQRVETSMTCT